jgi:hypothetical protein
VILGGRLTGFLLFANPQAFGREGNRVRLYVSTLKQLGCFHHSRGNFVCRCPTLNPRSDCRTLLRERFADGT